MRVGGDAFYYWGRPVQGMQLNLEGREAAAEGFLFSFPNPDFQCQIARNKAPFP